MNISITISQKSFDLLNEVAKLEHKVYGVSQGRSAIINKCIILQAENLINEIKKEIQSQKQINK